MKDDEDTYFTFDGSKNFMTYSYVEDGIKKYNGTYRVVSRGTSKDVKTPLTFIFTRSDKEKEDWIGCYVETYGTNASVIIRDDDNDEGTLICSIEVNDVN